MKLLVRHGEGELEVPSQKEFLVLYQRGFIEPSDLVKRESKTGEGKWVRADELPWIRGSAIDAKHDQKRLLGVTIVMMILGLLGALYIEARAAAAPKKKLSPAAVKK